MVVNFDGSIINLKDRMDQTEKRKSGSANVESQSAARKPESSSESGKQQKIADVIAIKKENKTAVESNPIRSQDDAKKLMDDLKNAFDRDLSDALKAHTKADPDRVMNFYPFE